MGPLEEKLFLWPSIVGGGLFVFSIVFTIISEFFLDEKEAILRKVSLYSFGLCFLIPLSLMLLKMAFLAVDKMGTKFCWIPAFLFLAAIVGVVIIASRFFDKKTKKSTFVLAALIVFLIPAALALST